jgi:hypothetical protein
MERLSNIRFHIILVITILLTACGGGSSDGGASPNPDPTAQPANNPPTASAGQNQTVDEGTNVTLSGSGSDSDGQIDAVEWRQISGLRIEIKNTKELSLSFEAPDVYKDESLLFELEVTDNNGAKSSDTVEIVIKPTLKHAKASLGFLLDAQVQVYNFSDLSTPVYTTFTDSSSLDTENLGRFLFPLDDISGDDLILIKVSGGADVDPDLNGVIEGQSEENLGTIHLITTANLAKYYGVNVSIVSELLYRKVRNKFELGQIDAIEGYLDSIAPSIISDINGDDKVDYLDVLSFSYSEHLDELIMRKKDVLSLSKLIRSGRIVENSSFTGWFIQILNADYGFDKEEFKVSYVSDDPVGNKSLLSILDVDRNGEFETIQYSTFIDEKLLYLTAQLGSPSNLYNLAISTGKNSYSLQFYSSLWLDNTQEPQLKSLVDLLPVLQIRDGKTILTIDKSLYESHEQTAPIVYANGTQIKDGESGFQIIEDDPVYSLDDAVSCYEGEEEDSVFLDNCIRYSIIDEQIDDWDESTDEKIQEIILAIAGIGSFVDEPVSWALSYLCPSEECQLVLDIVNVDYLSLVDRYLRSLVDKFQPDVSMILTSGSDGSVSEGDEVRSSILYPMFALKTQELGSFGYFGYGQLDMRLVKKPDCSIFDEFFEVVDNPNGIEWTCQDRVIAEWGDIVVRTEDSKVWGNSHYITMQNNQVITVAAQTGVFVGPGDYEYQVSVGAGRLLYTMDFSVVSINENNLTPPLAGFLYEVGDGFISVDASTSKSSHGGTLEYHWDVGDNGVIDLVSDKPNTQLFTDTQKVTPVRLQLKELGFGISQKVSVVERFIPPEILPPATPENVSLLVGDEQISISWNKVETADGYILYLSNSPAINDSTDNIQMSETSYVHKNLANGQTYYYAVQSINSVGVSEFSNVVSAVPIEPTLLDERYLLMSDGEEVLDLSTNLIWKRCEFNKSWNPETDSCDGDYAEVTIDEAINNIPSGYRLPTMLELRSIVYCSNTGEYDSRGTWSPCNVPQTDNNYERPTINQQAFPNTSPRHFFGQFPSQEWGTILFYSGNSSGGGAFEGLSRYVRDAP